MQVYSLTKFRFGKTSSSGNTFFRNTILDAPTNQAFVTDKNGTKDINDKEQIVIDNNSMRPQNTFSGNIIIPHKVESNHTNSRDRDKMKDDAIAHLSDQLVAITIRLQELERRR